ncbi:MAG: F0F1 ATP synthase subunit delta [Betaproteobacteria bacterium]|nr:F0F1 ATP synthase subunit delta [Betaproteobacteria bacterium]
MAFDWTTFALEIVNFLVLVWILSRFLYQPVRRAIAERQAGIERTLAGAKAAQAGAQALKGQYENRVADWEKEKAEARARLAAEIDAERGRAMDALRASLEQEGERIRALERRGALELRQQMEEAARLQGAQFVARLLARIANPGLQESIREALVEDLQHLPERQVESLHAARQAGDRIAIASAYPLDEEQRTNLVQALGRATGLPVQCEFAQDPELIAGFRISIGPWVLRSNLRDELKFFAEARHAGR